MVGLFSQGEYTTHRHLEQPSLSNTLSRKTKMNPGSPGTTVQEIALILRLVALNAQTAIYGIVSTGYKA